MLSASKNSASSLENMQVAAAAEGNLGVCKHMEEINCIQGAVLTSVQAGLMLGGVVGYIFILQEGCSTAIIRSTQVDASSVCQESDDASSAQAQSWDNEGLTL